MRLLYLLNMLSSLNKEIIIIIIILLLSYGLIKFEVNTNVNKDIL